MHSHTELITPLPNQEYSEILHIAEICLGAYSYENNSIHAFYDWYQVGGRFKYRKLVQNQSEEEIKEFTSAAKDIDNNFSDITNIINERDKKQINKLKQIWKKTFPDKDENCPFINKLSRKHDETECYVDHFPYLTALGETPKNLDLGTILFTTPDRCISFIFPDQLKLIFDKPIDSVPHTIKHALLYYEKVIDRLWPGQKERLTPNDEWIALTIDYHN